MGAAACLILFFVFFFCFIFSRDRDPSFFTYKISNNSAVLIYVKKKRENKFKYIRKKGEKNFYKKKGKKIRQNKGSQQKEK